MPQGKPKTLAEFRAAHDKSVIIPTRIRAQLAKMAAIHPEEWDYEADFLRNAGVANQDIKNYRDLFAKFIVEPIGKNAKRVWFATEKAAATARGVL
jgi:hypothetical protein